MPARRPMEISSGGVLARPAGGGWEFCLVLAGRCWGLPKGRIERGETAPQAALREISEECGIPQAKLRIVAELPGSDYVYRRAERLVFKRVHHFLVVTEPTTELAPQASEIDAATWLAPDEAMGRASFAATRAALAAALPLLDPAFD